MKSSLGFIVFSSLALAAGPARAEVTKAVATLAGGKDSKVSGTVTFQRVEGGVKVTAQISGLAAGAHGFHIHEFGDCSAADFASAGGHFNPSGHKHGSPQDAERHEGDLGNIEAKADQAATLEAVDKDLSFEGPGSILGRGVIVHAAADDLKSQPSGNAGARVACGVIGASKAP